MASKLISIILQIKKKFLIEIPIIELTIKNKKNKVFLNQAIFKIPLSNNTSIKGDIGFLNKNFLY